MSTNGYSEIPKSFYPNWMRTQTFNFFFFRNGYSTKSCTHRSLFIIQKVTQKFNDQFETNSLVTDVVAPTNLTKGCPCWASHLDLTHTQASPNHPMKNRKNKPVQLTLHMHRCSHSRSCWYTHLQERGQGINLVTPAIAASTAPGNVTTLLIHLHVSMNLVFIIWYLLMFLWYVRFPTCFTLIWGIFNKILFSLFSML
jgi:hypothetical protein